MTSNTHCPVCGMSAGHANYCTPLARMRASNLKTVSAVVPKLYEEFDEEVVAVVFISAGGNHSFAKWGGTPEGNSTALINASLHIMQEPS